MAAAAGVEAFESEATVEGPAEAFTVLGTLGALGSLAVPASPSSPSLTTFFLLFCLGGGGGVGALMTPEAMRG